MMRQENHVGSRSLESQNNHLAMRSPSEFARKESTASNASASNSREAKKKKEKQIQADRRSKMDAQSSEFDNGYIDVNSESFNISIPNFSEMSHASSIERTSSDQSTGSLLYGKTPNSGALWGKSSSLIFPTGVDISTDLDLEADNFKRRRVNVLLDQCESVRFPFKKKLMLTNLTLTAADIPLNYLCGTSLGNTLHKLSLAGNRLGSVPERLVVSLPTLKTLDLSQCELHSLPGTWNLPMLKRLNLSHNRLRDFPEEVS
jgi:Leucine-rich repeat (LRR) protein